MSAFQKRMVLSLALVGIAIIAVVIGLNITNQPSPATENDTAYSMTLESTIVANLTSIPQTTPLSDKNAPSPATEDDLFYSMTLDPTIVANLTSIPQTTPLSNEDAMKYLAFVEEVESCEHYTDERRAQMLQHIAWLVDPATIPSDMLIALGNNPDSGLVFGMAGYTSTQWRILERPVDSCLIEIGRALNLLLESFGREPFTIYDESN